MRRSLGPLTALILVLGACQIQLAEAPTAEKPTSLTRKARATARPAATPSPDVTAIATPSPTPTPSAAPTPAVPVRLLKGRVRIDAHYVLAVGAGNIISSNGGNVILAASGSLLGNNGGNLISVNGGSVLGNNGGGYRLLDAPGLGAMLPVKGMLVAPVSLSTGLPIGPAVLTDESGGYAVEVPEAQEENVLVLAAIPAQDEQAPIFNDTRLQYSLLAAPRGAERVLDEDEAVLTRYVRQVFAERLVRVFAHSEASFPVYLDELFRESIMAELGVVKELLKQSLAELHAEAVKAGVPSKPPAERAAIARRLADTMIAHIDMEAIKQDPRFYDEAAAGYDDWQATRDALDPNKPVLDTMRELLSFVRQRVAPVMLANGGTFPSMPYLVAVNERKAQAGLPPYEIQRPSDFCDYMIEEYGYSDRLFLHSGSETRRLVLESVDAAIMPGSGLITEGLIRVVEYSILVEVHKTLITDAEAKARLLGALDREGN